MFVLLQIIALTLLLLLAQEILRRANRWTVWGLFFLLPLLLTPYWIQVNEQGLFPWLKGYSVFFSFCFVTALRLTPLGNQAWARSTIPLLLAANILEAVAVDLYGRGWAHTLNAAAGLLLIATSPYGPESTRIDSAKSSRDLLYNTNSRWVVGYTIWNWAFVYLNYPELTGHQTAVLAAALIVGLYDPARWVQTRAATLGANILVTATAYKTVVGWFDTTAWYSDQLAIVAAIISVAFMIGCFLSSATLHSRLSEIAQLGRRFVRRRIALAS